MSVIPGPPLRFARLLHDRGRGGRPSGNCCSDLRKIRRISGSKNWRTSGKHARRYDRLHQELLPALHARWAQLRLRIIELTDRVHIKPSLQKSEERWRF